MVRFGNSRPELGDPDERRDPNQASSEPHPQRIDRSSHDKGQKFKLVRCVSMAGDGGVPHRPRVGQVFLVSIHPQGQCQIITFDDTKELNLVTDLLTVTDAVDMVHGPAAVREARDLQ